MNRRVLRAWARINRNVFAIAFVIGAIGLLLAYVANYRDSHDSTQNITARG